MIAEVEDAAAAVGLFVAGVADVKEGSIVLLGAGAGLWAALQSAPEFADRDPDPVDRYSTRVIGDMAARFDAGAVFPFGGPPYAPFMRWAMASGRAWQSPVGMLVHDTAGLMISYRGALVFETPLEQPESPAKSPCETCTDQPCQSACPVGALGGEGGYDVAACHAFLDTEPGADCMEQGCRARRACPVSARFGRDPAQSAYHMSVFHRRRDYH